MSNAATKAGAPIGQIIKAVCLSIFCSLSAAYYGMYGLPKGPEAFACHGLEHLNNLICFTPRSPGTQTGYQPANQLEGYLQAIYVSLVTWLAFLVHKIKQPEKVDTSDESREASLPSNDSAEPQPIAKPPTQSGWKDAAAEFITRPSICVIFLLIVPAVIFVAATINHGEQGLAVFVMALVAIYVAAEHYSSLERQGGIVRRQERLTDSLERQLGSLSNALGSSYSQQFVFAAYGRTPNDPLTSGSQRGIYAIYKYPDIDEKWWAPKPEEAWTSYFNIRGTKETLFSSLLHGQRVKVLFVVTNMPLKISSVAADRESQFTKVIGLAWYWVCLDEAAKEVAGADYEIKVATTSNWIHVVDNQVLQLIGTPPRNLRVRDLTFDINVLASDGGVTGQGAAEAGKNLVNWAINNIERVGERGTSAQEYLDSILMHWFIKRGSVSDEVIDLHIIDSFLDDIGFKEWLAGQHFNCPPNKKAEAREYCARVIYEFLIRQPMRPSRERGESSHAGPADFGWELQ